MDPNENIRQTAQALRDGNMKRANELREALTEWLERGGFEPDWGTEDASYVRGTLFKTATIPPSFPSL